MLKKIVEPTKKSWLASAVIANKRQLIPKGNNKLIKRLAIDSTRVRILFNVKTLCVLELKRRTSTSPVRNRQITNSKGLGCRLGEFIETTHRRDTDSMRSEYEEISAR